MSPIEKEFNDALSRLKEGKPLNSELAKKAKLGKLRINASTVAQEAGRSRSLIGYDGCKYPRVRAKLKELEDPLSPPTTFEDVNRKLREEVQELRLTAKVAMSQVAAMIRRMEHLDHEVERRIKQAKREMEAKYRKTDPNQIAGSRFDRRVPGTLIPFPNPSEENRGKKD